MKLKTITLTLLLFLCLSPKLLSAAVTEDAARAFLINILTLGEGALTNFLITRPLTISTASGNTLNQTVAVSTTTFWPLFGGAATTNLTSDVSTGTRNLVTLPTVLTNLYFYASASPGSGKTTTLTILTNGVSTGMSCALTATSKYSWAVNLMQ